MIIGLWPLKNNGDLNLYIVLLSISFLILGLLNSKLLNPLNKLWFKFGILLGNLISPIIMGLVYFFVITPIAMLLKIFNKDVLNLKQNKKDLRGGLGVRFQVLRGGLGVKTSTSLNVNSDFRGGLSLHAG